MQQLTPALQKSLSSHSSDQLEAIQALQNALGKWSEDMNIKAQEPPPLPVPTIKYRWDERLSPTAQQPAPRVRQPSPRVEPPSPRVQAPPPRVLPPQNISYGLLPLPLSYFPIHQYLCQHTLSIISSPTMAALPLPLSCHPKHYYIYQPTT